jgi:ATP-dependent protease ClpP protease subunit
MPNADFLIHWGTLELQGNHSSVEAEAHWAKRTKEIMLDIYVDRCKEGEFWEEEGYSEDDIRNFLREQMDRKQEYYMTPREAVEKGFFDAVLGDEEYETIKALRDG